MARTKVVGVGAAVALAGVLGAAVGVSLVGNDQGAPPRVADGAAQSQADGNEGDTGPWVNLAPSGAEEVEHFDSLRELSKSTEVVITGVVASAGPGRVLKDDKPGQSYQFLELTVNVRKDLARGRGKAYRVEFGPYLQEDLANAAWAKGMVGDEGVFVLRRKGSPNAATGATLVRKEFALNRYRLVSSQGLLLNDGGQVAVPLADEDAAFPNNLAGADFDATVARVDSLAD